MVTKNDVKLSKPKVTKKPRVKAVAKTTPKKQVKRKSSPKKVVKSKKSKESVKTAQKSKIKSETQIQVKKSVLPVLLSPFRFPIGVDVLALQTARFGGVAFVITGAIFTLLYSNLIFSQPSHNALGLMSASTIDSTKVSLDSAETFISGIATDMVNPEPTPEISVTGGSVLSDKITVKVKVSSATEVRLSAYYRSGGYDISIGKMTKVSDDSWELKLDTSKVSNGDYKLKVFIVNKAGSYEVLDTSYRTIKNVPLEFDESSDSDMAVKTHEVDVTEKIEYSKSDGDDREKVKDSVVTVKKEINPATETHTETTIKQLTQPDVKVEINAASPLSGIIDIRIKTESADFIEIYAIQKSSATYKYLGKARLLEAGLWSLAWDTRKLPNAEYKVAAKVKNSYGVNESFSKSIKILNQATVVKTEEQEIITKALKDTAKYIESEDVVKEKVSPEEILDTLVRDKQNDSVVSPDKEKIESGDKKNEAGTESVKEKIHDDLYAEHKQLVDEELKRLAAVVRSGDDSAISSVKNRIGTLKKQLQDPSLSDGVTDEYISKVEKTISEAVIRVEKDVERSNKIIKERTEIAATTDSDKDGITDYDEITFYQTDPFNADSDEDGFIDGAEVLSGYDPTDSTPQVAIKFESPKDTGVVREDLLVVESITKAAVTDEEKQNNAFAKAVITGKGLPNSFVTLYIFSTPVVVTIKTEADGSWQYRFDKELEDGQHEVYVGVTDNAGKIIAKSNPLTFIKEAEAFNETVTPVANTVVVENTGGNLISTYVIYLILSISVVSIGLVLIILGLHLDGRPRKIGIESKQASAI